MTSAFSTIVKFFIINGDLCINRNNHQKPTFHSLGDFLNPALALLGQGLKKSPIGTKKTILVTSGAGYIGFTLVWNGLKKAIEKLGWLAKLTINDMCADVWRFVSCLK
jgi:hypothetical protein